MLSPGMNKQRRSCESMQLPVATRPGELGTQYREVNNIRDAPDLMYVGRRVGEVMEQSVRVTSSQVGRRR